MHESEYRLILFLLALFDLTSISGISTRQPLQSEDIKVYPNPPPTFEKNQLVIVYDKQLSLRFTFRNEIIVLSLLLDDDIQTDISVYSLDAEDIYRIDDGGGNASNPAVPRRYKGEKCSFSIICQWDSHSLYRCQFSGVFLNRDILWGIVPLRISKINQRNYDVHLGEKSGFWHRIFKLPSNDSTYWSWPTHSFTREFHSFQNRRKRFVKETYTVELAIILHAQVFSQFLKALPLRYNYDEIIYFIKEYYTSITRGMSMMFNTMSSNKFTVEIKLTSLIYTYGRNTSNIFNDKNIDWMKFNDWYNQDSNTISDTCDYAVLLTTDAINDYREDTMCTSNSTAIIQETFNFKTAMLAIYSVGISLGIKPDSIGNTCSENEQYIMASHYVSVIEDIYASNQFRFSSCSQKYVEQFLNQNEKSFCLSTKSNYTESYEGYSLMPPGQRFTPSQQCAFRFGKKSNVYECEDTNFKNQDDSFCAGLFCLSEGACKEMTPQEGTSCGSRKWCFQGYCLNNLMAPQIPMNCWLGDKSSDSLLPGSNITCKDIAYGFATMCYDKRVRSVCCWSCHFLRTTRDSCPYGDRKPDCWANECKFYNEKRINYECCETCRITSGSYKENGWHVRLFMLATIPLNIYLI